MPISGSQRVNCDSMDEQMLTASEEETKDAFRKYRNSQQSME